MQPRAFTALAALLAQLVAAAALDHTYDFEANDFAGWGVPEGLGTQNFELHSGATESLGTGPDGDHTSGSGYYVYVEASCGELGCDAVCPSGTAYLESPTNVPAVAGGSIKEVAFWYSMYGEGQKSAVEDVPCPDFTEFVGTLALEALLPTHEGKGTDYSHGRGHGYEEHIWAHVWLRSGDQGKPWAFSDKVQVPPGTTAVRFRVETGKSWASDIALDDIVLTEIDAAATEAAIADAGGVDAIIEENRPEEEDAPEEEEDEDCDGCFWSVPAGKLFATSAVLCVVLVSAIAGVVILRRKAADVAPSMSLKVSVADRQKPKTPTTAQRPSAAPSSASSAQSTSPSSRNGMEPYMAAQGFTPPTPSGKRRASGIYKADGELTIDL